MQMTRQRYATVVCACIVGGLVLHFLGRVDSNADSAFARAFGIGALALVFWWLWRESASRTQFEDAGAWHGGAAGNATRLAVAIAAATCLVAVLVSCRFAQSASGTMRAGWAAALCLGIALLPLSAQAARDAGTRAASPWGAVLLLVIAAVFLLPALLSPGFAWNSLFLVPAAFCLAVEPALVWASTMRALGNAADGNARGHMGGFLAAEGIACCLALALALALLANLDGPALVSRWHLLAGDATFAAGIAAAAAIALGANGRRGKRVKRASAGEEPAAATATVTDLSADSVADSATDSAAAASAASAMTALEKHQSALQAGQAAFRQRNHEGCAILAERFGLSKRQRMVIEGIADGKPRGEIATDLVVSRNTVNTHARNAYAKMDIHGREELLDLIERAVGNGA